MIDAKEEILEKHNWSDQYPNSGFDPKEEIKSAMDEYARQEAIELLTWYLKREYRPNSVDRDDEKMAVSIYEKYLESKTREKEK